MSYPNTYQGNQFGAANARTFRDSYERSQAMNGNLAGPAPANYQQSTAFVGGPSQWTTGGVPLTTAYGVQNTPYRAPTSAYQTQGQTYGSPVTTYGGQTGGVIRTSHTEHSRVVTAGSPQIVQRPAAVQQTSTLIAPVVTGQSTYVGQSTLIGQSQSPQLQGRPTGGRVSIREIDTKVSTRVGEKKLVGRETRSSVVKGYNYGESRLVGESHREGGIINVTENRLEAIVRQSIRPEIRTRVNEVFVEEEEAVIIEKIVEKPIEVIIQRKVPIEKIIEVPYDVIVERPVEKIFHREIITERIMERPREKIIEIPVEVVYEIPVEKIIERHIEYETVVEVPVERIVERRVEEYIENIRYNDRIQEVDIRDLGRYPGMEILAKEVRTITQEKIIDKPIYLDNIVERIVQVPVDRIIEKVIDKIVEVPIERIIERPVYVDNLIQRVVEIPVQRLVEKPVERIIERPVYFDNIIEKPVAIERIVERRVEIPVERFVEVPTYVDNIIQKTVEIVREVERPYEQVIEIPVEQMVENAVGVMEFTEKPYERVYERPVKMGGTQTVPVEFIIEKDVYVPRENTLEIQVPQIIGKIVERDVVKTINIERITERPVPIEKIIEIPVRRIIEVPKFIETVIEREIPIEQTIERIIERIVERRVEVPVEKIIEVPVNINTERAITQERIQEELIDYEAKTLSAVQGTTQEQVVEVNCLL